MNHLHILTLNWNGADKLQKLYNSLIPSLKDINYTWLIKDNNSVDNSAEVVSKFVGNINYNQYPNNNQNFSEGCNYLFDIAKPDDEDYILLLNNDIVFNDTHSIKNMIKLFEKEKDVGVVGAKLKYMNTNKLQHAGVVFSQGSNGFPFHFRANEIDDSNASKNRDLQVVTGAVLLTKAMFYKNVCVDNKSNLNGLDEAFCWSFDDVDFCLHIKHIQNKRILYCGKTDIFHEESASLKKNPANKLFMNHNLLRLKTKWSKHIVLDYDMYKNNNNYNIIK